MYDDSKFFVLQGDLAYNDPGDYFASIFDSHDIETITQKIASPMKPWGEPSMFVLDYRHGLYDDASFCDYFKSVVAVNRVVRIADLPFHYEKLAGSNQEQMDMLVRRTKKAHEILGNDGLLISPSIGAFSEDISKLYLQYFKECGRLFQAFSVDCSIEGVDREIAMLVGLLNNLLLHCKREVWVTKWCVPSFDGEISTARMGDDKLTLQKTKVAALRMKQVYRTLNAVAPDMIWMISGAGTDLYNPNAKPETYAWDWPYASKYAWTKQNFMGLRSWDGTPKFHLAQALVEILDGRV